MSSLILVLQYAGAAQSKPAHLVRGVESILLIQKNTDFFLFYLND